MSKINNLKIKTKKGRNFCPDLFENYNYSQIITKYTTKCGQFFSFIIITIIFGHITYLSSKLSNFNNLGI